MKYEILCTTYKKATFNNRFLTIAFQFSGQHVLEAMLRKEFQSSTTIQVAVTQGTIQGGNQ